MKKHYLWTIPWHIIISYRIKCMQSVNKYYGLYSLDIVKALVSAYQHVDLCEDSTKITYSKVSCMVDVVQFEDDYVFL